MAYFLISVSNKTNLKLCIKYAIAGFTNSINGLWTYSEIKEGDYISFLYGARVFNLYKVIMKKAFKNAENLPPWPSVYFSMSRRTYYFPFRLFLEPVRKLNEPMIREEFAYVAENLLLRGGYRRTHFQADSITFYSVSRLGELYKDNDSLDKIDLSGFEEFIPKFCFKRTLEKQPEVFYFNELILQALVRHYLAHNDNLQKFFNDLGLTLNYKEFEVLGEKAFPEGHIDILIKDIHPKEKDRKIIIEIKREKAKIEHLKQLRRYVEEIKDECIAAVLIANYFPKNLLLESKKDKIFLVRYTFSSLNSDDFYSFDDLFDTISLSSII